MNAAERCGIQGARARGEDEARNAAHDPGQGGREKALAKDGCDDLCADAEADAEAPDRDEHAKKPVARKTQEHSNDEHCGADEQSFGNHRLSFFS